MKVTFILPAELVAQLRDEVSRSCSTQSQLVALALRMRAELNQVKQDLQDRAYAIEHFERTPWSLRFPNDWNGRDLKHRLKDLGILQRELAIKLGIPINTLNNWIRGVRSFPVGMLDLIRLTIQSMAYPTATSQVANLAERCLPNGIDWQRFTTRTAMVVVDLEVVRSRV